MPQIVTKSLKYNMSSLKIVIGIIVAFPSAPRAIRVNTGTVFSNLMWLFHYNYFRASSQQT